MTETMRANTKARILALFAKAEDPAVTEAEAEAYNAKAYELIARHGLDQARLRAELGAKAARDELTVKTIKLSGKYLTDQLLLMAGIGKAFRMQFLQKGRDEVVAFGFESDIERLEMLFSSLWLQASAKVAKTPTPFGENRVRFVKSFLAHFTRTVYKRLEAAEKHAEDEAAGYGLVVRDQGKNTVDFMKQWLKEQGIRTSKTRVGRSNSGKESGTAAGRTADIGQTKVGGGRLQIGSGR